LGHGKLQTDVVRIVHLSNTQVGARAYGVDIWGGGVRIGHFEFIPLEKWS
jgi:hypothetical protein